MTENPQPGAPADTHMSAIGVDGSAGPPRGGLREQGDTHRTPVEIDIAVRTPAKNQLRWRLCFGHFMGLDPICDIKPYLRAESLFPIREYPSNDCLPFTHRFAGQ